MKHGRYLYAYAYVSALFFLALQSYSKPYLPVSAQVDLLKRRGLIVSDDQKAENVLRKIGYYRLSGYWHPFRERTDQGEVLETFRAGTELAHVVDLYAFDKQLRILLLDAIERVEIGLRVDIALLLGEVGTWAHRDISNFNGYFRGVDQKDSVVRHTAWVAYLDALAGRSREDFSKHFHAKYGGSFPIWMAVELWDFGTLSTLVSGIHDKHLQKWADRYGLPRRTMLVSWLQSINLVRNICAHHGRLWNRPLINQPALPRPGELQLLQHLGTTPYRNSRMYAAASVLQYFLRTINPTSSWGGRLGKLVQGFPVAPGLTINSAGFKIGWEQHDLWHSPQLVDSSLCR